MSYRWDCISTIEISFSRLSHILCVLEIYRFERVVETNNKFQIAARSKRHSNSLGALAICFYCKRKTIWFRPTINRRRIRTRTKVKTSEWNYNYKLALITVFGHLSLSVVYAVRVNVICSFYSFHSIVQSSLWLRKTSVTNTRSHNSLSNGNQYKHYARRERYLTCQTMFLEKKNRINLNASTETIRYTQRWCVHTLFSIWYNT